MAEYRPDDITIAWCHDPGIAAAASTLFVEQTDPAYISHGELQSGRAIGRTTWAEDLEAQIDAMVRRAVANTDDGNGLCLATMMQRDALVGFALVTFVPEAPRPYAVLDDVLIATVARGQGLGDRFMAWLEHECRARGVARLFLESGESNHRAHTFFARHGFRQTSIVMMRDL